MFDRINTSSLPLCSMEKRKGVYKGDFNDFVFKIADDKKFGGTVGMVIIFYFIFVISIG